jgi:hypothetical protein
MAAELQEGVDGYRLLEIETIVRLLLPNLASTMANAAHTGRAGGLGDAGEQLVAMESCLRALERERDRRDVVEDRERLLEAVRSASRVLNVLQSM